MAVKYELRAKTGEKKDGSPYYMTIGRIMESQKGGYVGKFDFIPIGWDGWVYLSTPKAKEEAPKEVTGSFKDMENDVPF